MGNILILSKIEQLKNIQNGLLWIGTNFNKKINLLNSSEFFSQEKLSNHSVAEIISHLTCWRRECILKIKTGKGSIKDDNILNWLTNKELKLLGKNRVLSDYNNSLKEIIELLHDKDDSFLEELYFDTDFDKNFNYTFLIDGMIHHDLYHLGQLGIIIKNIT